MFTAVYHQTFFCIYREVGTKLFHVFLFFLHLASFFHGAAGDQSEDVGRRKLMDYDM